MQLNQVQEIKSSAGSKRTNIFIEMTWQLSDGDITLKKIFSSGLPAKVIMKFDRLEQG